MCGAEIELQEINKNKVKWITSGIMEGNSDYKIENKIPPYVLS